MKKIALVLLLLIALVSMTGCSQHMAKNWGGEMTITLEPGVGLEMITAAKLVSDKAVDVKKSIQASNKITLSMKDIRASKTLNTIYNNVSNVDSVMVEPQGNGIKIFIQADNVSASTITFDALVTTSSVPVKSSKQSLKLNNPIESYAPIYNENFEDVKTSSLFNRLKSSSSVENLRDSIE